MRRTRIVLLVLCLSAFAYAEGSGMSLNITSEESRHTVSAEHPRLLGTRQRLQRLAQERPDAYQRIVRVAREQQADEHAKLMSMALVSAIEQDASLGRQTITQVLKTIRGPIRQGHVTFGHDLARCALVYDLCHEYWESGERDEFHDYMNRTVDANIRSETHVFHNGWYGYKHWGIGLACYASYHDNPRAPEILDVLKEDWTTLAAPALELAGDGGGWAEGYYIHYWLYEWLFFCEAAHYCEGWDLYSDAPNFFRNRAVASMFECYPGIGQYNSRRMIPMGDGGGRTFGGDRDKALSARRILVNAFHEDTDHQVVHAFNEITPRSSVGVYAYRDFLWRDTGVKISLLNEFRLSHFSPGAGYVYARSSWDDDATYLFFRCSDRFTAHQHLDVGHFLIYKHEELVGDGGHYDGFGTPHDANYHLRSIAHNTVLVHDPNETWPAIRAADVTSNDGGQHHGWPHHNGAVVEPQQWHQDRDLYDIADVLAFEDQGEYLYVAGDCTRAYAPTKMKSFTRQIVFLRPGTFVIFDQVKSTQPEFRKTWLLQAMKPPTRTDSHLVVTNGRGRLFVQILLPKNPQVQLVTGDELYRSDGRYYPPTRNTGPAPECRIEISPPGPSASDEFLHVLTATDSDVEGLESATMQVSAGEIQVSVGNTHLIFSRGRIGGSIEIAGDTTLFAGKIIQGDTATMNQ